VFLAIIGRVFVEILKILSQFIKLFIIKLIIVKMICFISQLNHFYFFITRQSMFIYIFHSILIGIIMYSRKNQIDVFSF
jgi:hypothetical protein